MCKSSLCARVTLGSSKICKIFVIKMANTKEIPRPEWMDDEFLVTSIKSLNAIGDKAKIQIEKVTLSYVVPKGENYLSILYRANVGYAVDGGADEESLVIKVSHDLSPLVPSVFDREIEIFKDIIPALSETLQRNNLNPRFTCRYAHSSSGKPKILVLDDLKALGYAMLDRTKGLDLHHTKMIMNKLAQYHATTMCYFEKQSKEVKLRFSKSPFSENIDGQMKMMVQRRVEAIVGEISKDNKYTKAVEFFKRYAASFDDKSGLNPPLNLDSKMNVLAHTDFWINNIMFKYDKDGSLEDLVFVDFQASHYGSPAYDFYYIFISGTSNEVKMTYFEDLKNYYFERLVGYMETFGYGGEIPTIDDFENELKQSILTAILVLVVLLPIFFKSYDKEVQNREDDTVVFPMDQVVSVIGEENSGNLLKESVQTSVDVLLKHGYFDHYPEN